MNPTTPNPTTPITHSNSAQVYTSLLSPQIEDLFFTMQIQSFYYFFKLPLESKHISSIILSLILSFILHHTQNMILFPKDKKTRFLSFVSEELSDVCLIHKRNSCFTKTFAHSQFPRHIFMTHIHGCAKSLMHLITGYEFAYLEFNLILSSHLYIRTVPLQLRLQSFI